MDVGQYLQVVRRRWLVIAVLLMLGLAAGAGLHLAKTPVYQASADILLLPDDPSEQVDGQSTGSNIDPTSYSAVQISVITARDVAARAASLLDTTPEQVQSAVTVTAGDSPSVLIVTARSKKAVRASAIANGLIDAFIQERREAQVNALTKAADEIAVQLTDLGSRIAVLQNQVAGGQSSPALAGAYQQYTNLTVRQSDLRVKITLQKGSARVLTQAATPTGPSGRGLPVDTVLGGLLGLMIGLGYAFLRNQVDDRVREREELERLTGLPVLTELPVDRPSARQEGYVATDADPLGQLAEATRSLRTGITFLGVEEPIRRLAVTSGLPGEGKTLVAVNLGAAFAQAGVRTVLVSADLRRSRLESALGLERTYEGLSTVLIASPPRGRTQHLASDDPRHLADHQHVREALDRALVATGVPNLALLPAGRTPPNPAELLGSRRMDEVLDELDALFDLIIIDTSPVLPVTDAAALAPKAGHVLLVASAGATRRHALARTMTLLERTQADLLGVVFNRVRVQPGMGKGQYYGVQAEEPLPAPRSISFTRARVAESSRPELDPRAG